MFIKYFSAVTFKLHLPSLNPKRTLNYVLGTLNFQSFMTITVQAVDMEVMTNSKVLPELTCQHNYNYERPFVGCNHKSSKESEKRIATKKKLTGSKL